MQASEFHLVKPGTRLRLASGSECTAVTAMVTDAGELLVEVAKDRGWIFAGDAEILEDEETARILPRGRRAS